MAKKVPHNFLESGELAVASYNFFDIADGTGVIEFYPTEAATATSTFVQRLVNSTSHYSENNGVTTATGSLDIDFDVTFNRPQTLDGTMYVAIPIAAKASSGTITISVTLTIKHFDGTTETTLGTAQTSPVLSTTTTSEWVSQMIILTWDIARTLFKAGDTLRITLTDTISGNGSQAIGHSPIGTQRTATGLEFNSLGTSRATAFVPFDIDL